MVLSEFELIIGLMIGAFLVSLVAKTNTVVDFFWGMGFVLVAWYSLLFRSAFEPRQIITTLLVTLWGLRLSSYLMYRYWSKGEDLRYVEMAKKWSGNFYLHSFFKVFMLQGILLYLISRSIIVINTQSGAPTLGVIDFLCFGLWIVGFLCEVIGDRQLQLFLSQPEDKGRIMDKGLWQYTRHPNYFGEMLMWWALWGVAVLVSGDWIVILSPLTITGIIIFFSVPITESQWDDSAEYQGYKKRTNALIPWIPAKISNK